MLHMALRRASAVRSPSKAQQPRPQRALSQPSPWWSVLTALIVGKGSSAKQHAGVTQQSSAMNAVPTRPTRATARASSLARAAARGDAWARGAT